MITALRIGFRLRRATAIVAVGIALTACGGSTSADTFSLGGTISGLTGNGLVLINGGERLTVSASALTFVFTKGFTTATAYAVTVQSAPPGLSCSVAAGTGTFGTANVDNVVVNCADNAYAIGGSIRGLDGAGLILANGTDKLSVSSGSTTFTMPMPVADTASYAISVAAQPAGQSCSVSNGSGAMPAANVATVAIVCSANAYTLGGSISGLITAGLVLTDGTDTMSIAVNSTGFMFPTALVLGSHYHVAVQTQPTNSTCNVGSATGTIPAGNVASLAVTCAIKSFTLGGSISGGTLTATGLILSDGTDTLTVAANASIFSMPTGVASGTAYSVTVAAQAAGLVCTVTNGSGTMPTADVSDVQVTCAAREWTWEAGSKTINAPGIYGARGVAAAGNTPSQRDSEMNWSDQSGRLWLFGGSDQSSSIGDLNDLWMYDPASGLWTWESGSNAGSDPGNYGTQGVAAVGNSPPSRHSGVTWLDSSGHLWLFGGFNDATLAGSLNDLWMYNISTGQWTWVNGPAAADDPGSAGTQGVAAAGNLPSSRVGAMGWSDSAGRFWLYGGAIPGGGGLTANDLWMYDPGAALWTWVNGSTAATVDATAVFGSQGVPAAGNTPGARQGAATWTDNSGHLWLFGGSIYDASVQSGEFGDLWSYDLASNQWTWVSGATTQNATGTNGTRGIGAASNTPGARTEPGFWTDRAGRFWLFGGAGYGADSSAGGSWLSDLWSFDPATQQWTWVNGPADPSNNAGIYGTKGTPSTANVPGGRVLPVGWVDSNGSFWMFGGYGADSQGSHFDLNDLWKF